MNELINACEMQNDPEMFYVMLKQAVIDSFADLQKGAEKDEDCDVVSILACHIQFQLSVPNTNDGSLN